jgi:hypothetical protein
MNNIQTLWSWGTISSTNLSKIVLDNAYVKIKETQAELCALESTRNILFSQLKELTTLSNHQSFIDPKEIIYIISQLNTFIIPIVNTKRNVIEYTNDYEITFRAWENDTVDRVLTYSKNNDRYIYNCGQKLVKGPNGMLFFARNSKYITKLIIGKNNKPLEIKFIDIYRKQSKNGDIYDCQNQFVHRYHTNYERYNDK